MTTFAENLRYYREKANYSQKDLAKLIDVSVAAYNKYETRGNEPKIDILIKLATALNIDVNTLVGFRQTTNDYLQIYMDCTNNAVLKEDNGYIVFLKSFPNIPKFHIPSDELENIVNACRKETKEHTSTVYKAIKEVERQYFCNTLSVELGNYLDKISAAPGTETPLKDSDENK